MYFTIRKEERQAKMVCRFIEGALGESGNGQLRTKRKEGRGGSEGRYILKSADQGVTGPWEGMCGGSRPPVSNTWFLSPREMHGAGISPPVESLPTLFAPIPPAVGLCPLLISMFPCAGRSQWAMALGQGSSPLSTLPVNSSVCWGDSILRAPKREDIHLTQKRNLLTRPVPVASNSRGADGKGVPAWAWVA